MAEKEYRFDVLYGNERLKEQFSSCLREKRLAHAYLLEGAEGSGRHTIARLIAMALCCTNTELAPCGHCPNCRKVADDASPDVRMITPAAGRKTIGIDVIRAMREDVYILPNDGEWKVYILSPAEEMTEEAQNAFLKVLEEPPAGVVFFLLTTDRSRLLNTVLSRIQLCHTEVFDAEQLRSYLIANLPGTADLQASDPIHLERLLQLSGGSIGKAIRYLTEKEETLQKDIPYQAHMLACRLFDIFSGSASAAQKRVDTLMLLQNSVRSLPLAKELLLAMTEGYGELAAYKKSPDILPRFFTGSELEHAAAAFTVRQCVTITAALTECLMLSDANPNLNLYLTNICRTLTGGAASGKGTS